MNGNVEITAKDLYQFLIVECRYGYARNNHLMPGGAYDHVKKYLPLLLNTDSDWAIDTARQLCEECIGHQLTLWNEPDDDDKYNNRHEALEFVEYLLDFIHSNSTYFDWTPFNYSIYVKNKGFDDQPIYNIYEINYETIIADDVSKIRPLKQVNNELLSRNDLPEFFANNIIKKKEYSYRKYKVGNKLVYIFDDIQKAYIIQQGGETA